MIVLLGATGYIGEAFAAALEKRQWPFVVMRRSEVDYTSFPLILDYLQGIRPAFLINCAGYTGKPNVDACESAKADTLQGNTLFPINLAHACALTKTPWGHVSSGCIFSGAKVSDASGVHAEKNLLRPELKSGIETGAVAVRGYTELDLPNFSFRDPPYSFYSATKALAEEALAGETNVYIWRLRIPFDHIDNPRNYLSKVQRYSKVYVNFNSLSHRGDFASAALDLWDRRAPFGTYNMTNPGFVTTRQVVEMLEGILKPDRKFEYWASDEEFYRVAASTPRSNCLLDVSKLLNAGVAMRSVEAALEDSLRNWVPQTR